MFSVAKEIKTDVEDVKPVVKEKKKRIRSKPGTKVKAVKKEVQKMRKIKRNLGEEYVTATGKVVAKRIFTEIGPCKKNCNRIPMPLLKDIHEQYWKLGNYNLRVASLANLIDIRQKRKERKREGEWIKPRNREYSFTYNLIIGFERVPICAKCFKCIFSESEQFIKTTIKKKLESTTILQQDMRGKHSTPRKVKKVAPPVMVDEASQTDNIYTANMCFNDYNNMSSNCQQY